MELSLRKCTTEDLDILRDLAIKIFQDTFADKNSPENMEEYINRGFAKEKLYEELKDCNSDFFFLNADGNIAGYMKINETPSQTEINDRLSLEIERLYMSAEYQGKGLGQYMMQQAINIAQRREKRYIWLGVWEKNEKALRFYKNNGFYKIGAHSFVMGDDDQTDFLMRKDLA